MKFLSTLAIFHVFVVSAHAATTAGATYQVNMDVPDNSAIGLSSTQQFSSSITSITGVQVQLTITGGWAGDLYAYLSHSGGISVLLNRPGKSVLDTVGSGASELSLLFHDGAALDIHTGLPVSGAVIGSFQPDGRLVDPEDSLGTSPRTAFLSAFDGMDASGDWTLFVADLATGDTAKVESWTLSVTGVPEPSTALLVLLGAGVLLRRERSA